MTRNLEKAVAAFTARADVRSAVQLEATTEVLTGEGRKAQTLKLAFVWIGDLQYEFIEPVAEAVPVFSSWLPDGDGPRFHHSCARVEDWGGFRRRVGQQPHPVLFEGASGEGLKLCPFTGLRELALGDCWQWR